MSPLLDKKGTSYLKRCGRTTNFFQGVALQLHTVLLSEVIATPCILVR